MDPVAETRVVAREAAKLGFPVRAIAYVNLTRPDAAEVIAQHRSAAGGAPRQALGRDEAVSSFESFETASPSLRRPCQASSRASA